jgi:hypothetical protein
MEWMLEELGKQRMTRIRKRRKKKRERESGKTTKRQVFPFCVHLGNHQR